MAEAALRGAGLGLRRALLEPFLAFEDGAIDFLEVAPENWIGLGGTLKPRFEQLAERYPVATHGLSLSLGGPDPLDEELLRDVGRFLDRYRVPLYSEHLSYCAAGGQLYDLAPIPFTEEAVRHTAARIRRAQELLRRRIAIENVSYYAAPGRQMDESDFVCAVLEEADCLLLLDLNNVYVNSVNHGYDPQAYLAALPPARVAYCHIAGHRREAEDLIIDTHGADVIEPVWALLDAAYARFGPQPTLLERDFNFPPVAQLLAEVARIRDCQRRAAAAPA